MEKAVKGAMLGMALTGSAAKAETPQSPEPMEQKAFVPQTMMPDVRRPKVVSTDLPAGSEAPEGYFAQDIPGGKIQFVEDVPDGYFMQQTPDGRQYVQECPAGFHREATPDGHIYVQNNPDGSDDIDASADADEGKKTKRRK